MAFCADSLLVLHSAWISYLPLEATRYGKWAELAQEVLAVLERPMTPTRMGAIVKSRVLSIKWDNSTRRKQRFNEWKVVINNTSGLEIKYATAYQR